jgi:serine/threonine protein phosphatase PrpC
MDFIVSASTDVGIKKTTNQDSYGAKILHTTQGKMLFAILCDGMGGLSMGEVASATLVHAFLKWVEESLEGLLEEPLTDDVIRAEWEALIRENNDKIKNYGKEKGVNLGTTVTAILITQDRYYIIHVGDCRAYEIRHSLRRLTEDQSLVAREVRRGNLTEDEAERDPRRSVLLQCVGVLDTVEPLMYFGKPYTNTVYMICSDGFRHQVSELELMDFLAPPKMLDEDSMQKNMNRLIQMNKERQETDNISVLTIKIYEPQVI